jgi:hypothetical protein
MKFKSWRTIGLSFFAALLVVALLLVSFQIDITPKNSNSKVCITIGNRSVVEASGLTAPDYYTTGVNDNIPFQQALNALPAVGGELMVLSGTYNFAATVTRAIANVTIVGTGAGSYFTYDGATPIFTAGGNKWKFENLRTDAGSISMGATTGWIWENVTINATYYTYLTDSTGDFDTGTVTADSLEAPTGRAANYVIASTAGAGREQADLVTADVSAASVQVAITAAAGGKVVFLGDFTKSVKTGISLPSNIEVELIGSITLANSINDDACIFDNADTTNGNTGIYLHGGTLEGNEQGQTAADGAAHQYGLQFTKVTNSKVDMTISGFRSFDAKLNNCKIDFTNRWFGEKYNQPICIYPGLAIRGPATSLYLTIIVSPAQDLRNKSMVFDSAHTAYGATQVEYSADGGSNYYTLPLGNPGYASSPELTEHEAGEFVRQRVQTFSDKEYDASARLRSVNRLKIRVPNVDNLYIGNVWLLPLPDYAQVSFGFDDAGSIFESSFAPTLAKYGYKGTWFVGSVSGAGPADFTYARILHDSWGWDISSHGTYHKSLDAITYDEIIDELTESKRRLIECGYANTGAEFYAAPEHDFNWVSYKALKDVFSYYRNPGRYGNMVNPVLPWNEFYNGLAYTADQFLFMAQRGHGWFWLVLHNSNTNEEVDAYCGAVQGYSLKVVKPSEVWGQFKGTMQQNPYRNGYIDAGEIRINGGNLTAGTVGNPIAVWQNVESKPVMVYGTTKITTGATAAATGDWGLASTVAIIDDCNTAAAVWAVHGDSTDDATIATRTGYSERGTACILINVKTAVGANKIIAFSTEPANLDLSAAEYITLKIRTTAACDAGELQLGIDQAADMGTAVFYDLPALTANTTTLVCLNLNGGAAAGAGANSTSAIGIKDTIGDTTRLIYLDDIKGITVGTDIFTGENLQTTGQKVHKSTTPIHILRKNTNVNGTHTGANDAAVLTDSTGAWVTNELIGLTITNITDGSTATITANTSTTITGTLGGGTEDDWDTGDVYSIAGSDTLVMISVTNDSTGLVGSWYVTGQGE